MRRVVSWYPTLRGAFYRAPNRQALRERAQALSTVCPSTRQAEVASSSRLRQRPPAFEVMRFFGTHIFDGVCNEQTTRSLLMLPNASDLSPADRRREIASILARGVIRWHRRARSAGIIDTEKSPPSGESGLELSGKTRLSVGTRGFTPRSDGDEA